jgi:hypothetical protein
MILSGSSAGRLGVVRFGWAGARRRKGTVVRDTVNSSSGQSEIVYSPVPAMRTSSRCCFGESFGCLPRSLPLARATAMSG